MSDNNNYKKNYLPQQQRWYKMIFILSLCGTFIILTSASNYAPAQKQDADKSTQQTQKQTGDMEDIAKQLKKSDPAKTGLPPENAATADKPLNAQQAKLRKLLRPEGTIIISRIGRMVRSDVGGEWLFTFDADSTGKLDPPMILMPCRLLERMERLVSEDGDQVKFIVSGQIYEYYNRNYLMPTVMSVPYKRDNLSP